MTKDIALVKRFRKVFNLSAKDVAMIFDVSQSYSESWHSGHKPIPFAVRQLMQIYIKNPAACESYNLVK